MKYGLGDGRGAATTKKKIRFGSQKRRIWFSLFFFLLIMSLYIWRVLQFSIFSDELKRRAEEQSQTVISVKGRRGDIVARDGQVIAKDIPSYSVWINPRSIKKDEQKMRAIVKVADVLMIDRRELERKLSKDVYFIWLKRKISQEKLNAVMSVAKMQGLTNSDIGYIREWKRFYPYGEALAHLVGFTNIDSQGIAGLELYYDRFLQGGEMKISFLRDALGKIIMSRPPQEPRPGSKLETTVDLDLQINLYKELRSQFDKMRAKGAFAVAMNPKTGEILAAVSLPSFDPANYSNFANTKNLSAQFYQHIFEPGSVFKSFTIAIALEEGVISEKDTFFCHNGRWTFKTVTIEDVKGIGYASLSEVFARSSNICAAQISLLVGKEKMYAYLERLGFGRKTGIDLPGEESGILHDYRKWYDVDLAVIGFGYFVSVNAVQLVRAFSVFANGGYLIKPFVVRRIVSPYGEVLMTREGEIGDKVFSPQTVNRMKELMRDVVLHGTGKLAEVPIFLSAGKTGTARKLKGGKYVKEYYSNFVGFCPFDDPKIVIFIVFDEPEERYYGGEVAAPIFAKVVERYMLANYPEVANRSREKKTSVEYPQYSSAPNGHRMTLSEFLRTVSVDKESKSIVVRGHGFVREVRESENEIIVFLSP